MERMAWVRGQSNPFCGSYIKLLARGEAPQTKVGGRDMPRVEKCVCRLSQKWLSKIMDSAEDELLRTS